MTIGKRKPGTVPPNRIAVIDRHGNIRGHVGRTATTATVSRFLGHPRAKLSKVDGKTVWVEQKGRKS